MIFGKDWINNTIVFSQNNYSSNGVRLLHNHAFVGLLNISHYDPEIHKSILSISKSNKLILQSSRRKSTKEQVSSLAKANDSGQLTVGQKVKQTTKDASYLAIIIGGISITGIMFYAIFRELFSGHSPNVIYGKTLKRCKEDSRIIDACGEPIKGYGETTTRGRRRHVSHMEYVKDGLNYMRMKFYIEGNRRKGVVHLEMKENDKGKYDYRYLFVELEGYPQQTIILEDNRHIF